MKYTIEKSNSSFGNWVVLLPNNEVKYFWSKASAQAWALTH